MISKNNEMQHQEKSISSLPEMNINLSTIEKVPELTNSEQIVSICKEIIEDIRNDTREIDDSYKFFLDMVTNGGDATTSSKEAVVNLLKLKAEQVDKKTQVTNMLINAFLKQNYAPPRIFSAHQHNEIKIEDNTQKRKFLKSLQEGKNENK